MTDPSTIRNIVADILYISLWYHIKHSRIVPTSIPVNLQHSEYSLLLIIISRDVSLNPGPVRYPCGECGRPVASTHRAVYCEALSDRIWHGTYMSHAWVIFARIHHRCLYVPYTFLHFSVVNTWSYMSHILHNKAIIR